MDRRQVQSSTRPQRRPQQPLQPQQQDGPQRNGTETGGSVLDSNSDSHGSHGNAGSVKIVVPSLGSSPGGSGSQRALGQCFHMNPSNGTMSFALPIATPAGRSGFGPNLALSYDSGAGNGPFGLGWQLESTAITRQTSRHVPRYDSSDVFVLTGAEELVPRPGPAPRVIDGFMVTEYLPRVVAEAMRIERWTNTQDADDVHWRCISAENVTTIFGRDDQSRVFHQVAGSPKRIFSWLACERYDASGNAIRYAYKAENCDGVATLPAERQVLERSKDVSAVLPAPAKYLKSIHYGNREPNRDLTTWSPLPSHSGGWLFSAVLDYGEHDPEHPTTEERTPWLLRKDPYTTCRSAFELRYRRLCHRLLVFHHFPERLGRQDCLVRSLSLAYGESEGDSAFASLLAGITERGHRPVGEDGVSLQTQSMPPWELSYAKPPLAESLPLKTLDSTCLIGVPSAADPSLQWLDLYGEGASGILQRAKGGSWTYQRNENALLREETEDESETKDVDADITHFREFGRVTRPGLLPNGSGDADIEYFEDIDGDGNLELVVLDSRSRFGGYYQSREGGWEEFVAFESTPSVGASHTTLMRLDLTGNGMSDMLLMDEVSGDLVWYECLGKKGFGPEQRIPADASGPRIVSGDNYYNVYLADMTGDGLLDVVRIGPGKVSYWPNLSRGRFAEEVVMYDAPMLDDFDSFSHQRLRLASVYGTGLTDLLYFPSGGGCHLYRNLHGGGWAPATTIPSFPVVTSSAEVQVLDLMGNGTSCICWTGVDATGSTPTVVRFVDPADGRKPLVLRSVENGLGQRIEVKYKSSNSYYLQDDRKGTPWKTRIGFPVQCVDTVKITDTVTGKVTKTRFAYHDGYFDREEREFRGFGMVEQWDAETLNPAKRNLLRSPPTLKKTWFHTGASDVQPSFSRACGEPSMAVVTAPTDLEPIEISNVHRAVKGRMLREEVYGDDGSPHAQRPLLVKEYAYTVRTVQQRTSATGSGKAQEGVYRVSPRATLEIYTERGDAEPRKRLELVLEVNDFNDVVLSASVAYGRNTAPAMSGFELSPQQETIVKFVENDFTNPCGTDESFRKPLVSASRQYRLVQRGSPLYSESPNPQGERSSYPSAIEEVLFAATGIRLGTGSKLIRTGETRHYYSSATHLSKRLDLGALEDYSIHYQSFTLVSTYAQLVETYGPSWSQHGRRIEDLGKQGRYQDLDGDKAWWQPSSRALFSDDPSTELTSARRSFFQPTILEDPLSNVTRVTLDEFCLRPVETTDATGGTTSATYDSCSLQVCEVTDLNRNRVQAVTDCFGRTVAVARCGKQDGGAEGDSLQGIEGGNLADGNAISSFFQSPSVEKARSLLRDAGTMRIHQDLAFVRSRGSGTVQPNAFADITRTSHAADGDGPIMVSFTYVAGDGTVAQEVQLADVERNGSMTWKVSEWVVPNNKGEPLRVYQPCFSPTHHFTPGSNTTSPFTTMLYDAYGRAVGTLNPDRTYRKVRYEAWTQTAFDEGDNVLVSNPAEDPDVGAHFTRLEPESYLPTWHTQRTQLGEGDIGDGGKQQPIARWTQRTTTTAARNSEVFSGTSTATHLNALGQQILTAQTVESGRSLTTRFEYDLGGRRTAHIDALGRVVERLTFDLAGRPTCRAGMDDGYRYTVWDCMDRKILEWDSRRACTRRVYDSLGREVEVHEAQKGGPEALVVRRIFGHRKVFESENITLADAEARNLHGELLRVFDQSGVYTTHEYDFKRNARRMSTQFLTEYKSVVDWKQTTVPRADEIFETCAKFDALDRPTESTDARGAVTKHEFNLVGLMRAVHWKPSSDADWTTVIKDAQFSADGQPLRIEYGNTTLQTMEYDESTRLLTRRQTVRGRKTVLEDTHYAHDVGGRVSHSINLAEKSEYFFNDVIDSAQEYRYDALGRLVLALGRQQVGVAADGSRRFVTPSAAARMPLRARGDGSQMSRYMETYTYDDAGNILTMCHEGVKGAPVPGWTRHYTYAEPSLIQPGMTSNRLSQTAVGGESEKYGYDGDSADSGCISSMPGPMVLTWDAGNRLQSTTSQVQKKAGGRPETTWYVYNANGERVRKVTERSVAEGMIPTPIRETLYLAGVDIYRKYGGGDGNNIVKERTTHAIRGATRVAIAERAKIAAAGGDAAMGPPPLMRYQTTNNLELDGEGLIVSYEEHTPFGSPTYTLRRSKTEAGRRYRFAAYERDKETAFDYCNARYYVAWLGRWLSPDPIGIGDGLNVYCYVGDDPVNFHDPSGTMKLFQKIKAFFGGSKNKIAPAKTMEQVGEERKARSNKGFSMEPGVGAENNNPDFQQPITEDDVKFTKFAITEASYKIMAAENQLRLLEQIRRGPASPAIDYSQNRAVEKKNLWTFSNRDPAKYVHDKNQSLKRGIELVDKTREKLGHLLKADEFGYNKNNAAKGLLRSAKQYLDDARRVLPNDKEGVARFEQARMQASNDNPKRFARIHNDVRVARTRMDSMRYATLDNGKTVSGYY